MMATVERRRTPFDEPGNGTGTITARCKTVPYFLTTFWLLTREAAAGWVAHSRQGAALAYYSVFSLGPLMVIAIAIAGLVFGRDAARGEVEVELQGLLGEAAAKAVDAMLVGASAPRQGLIATAIGAVILLFTAVGVVVQLKDAFNTVWEVDTKKISGLWQFIRAYLVSVAAVMTLGFLLLVSLLFTAALSVVGKYVGTPLPEAGLQITGSLVSFAAIAALFTMMFKWLPDTQVDWRDVWLGAAITAALFETGKLLIYIGKQALDSTYGAAASLVVLLIWVYYSSQIVLLGAEFTHAYSGMYRRAAPPADPCAMTTRPAIG
jgi:membrane protein